MSTSPRHLSDRHLRVVALAAVSFVPVMVLLGLATALAAGTSLGSFGEITGDVAFALVVATFPLTGLLILWRQPRNRVGWLLQGVGVAWGLSMLADNYAIYGLVVSPGSIPGPAVAAALSAGGWAPGIGLMGTFLVLLFPDGHLPSRRWAAVAWVSAASITVVTVAIAFMPGKLDESAVPGLANPLGWEAGERLLVVLLAIFLPLLPVSIVACALSLVQRFRRSDGVERLQLKWLATAGTVVAVLYLTMMAVSWLRMTTPYSGAEPLWLSALQTLSILSFALLPAAIGVAILRHRLYDIDLVINRTLVYGGLTLTLAGVYVGAVLLLQLILNPLAHQSDLAVAGSTLAVAALFRPVRARVQAVVDRRFYRARYDMARTIDAFTARLRHEVDLDAVGGDLRSTVNDTVQPAHLSLWIRP